MSTVLALEYTVLPCKRGTSLGGRLSGGPRVALWVIQLNQVSLFICSMCHDARIPWMPNSKFHSMFNEHPTWPSMMV